MTSGSGKSWSIANTGRSGVEAVGEPPSTPDPWFAHPVRNTSRATGIAVRPRRPRSDLCCARRVRCARSSDRVILPGLALDSGTRDALDDLSLRETEENEHGNRGNDGPGHDDAEVGDIGSLEQGEARL